MALLPYALRPAVILRRKAIWGGILGSSKFWKFVAVWVFGKRTIKTFFGKSPEKLGTFKVGANSFVNVINAKPMPKKQRSRLGITKQGIIDQAVADVSAAKPDKGIRVVK